MGVGQPGSHLLCLFGSYVYAAWDSHAYQVGSSLTEKRGWRDVDVRLILDDGEYAALIGDDAGKLNAHNLAWSMFGRTLTGLPIDFQIQQQTEANADNTGPRSALVVLDTHIPTVQTAAERREPIMHE